MFCINRGPMEINKMAWSEVWSCLGFAKIFLEDVINPNNLYQHKLEYAGALGLVKSFLLH